MKHIEPRPMDRYFVQWGPHDEWLTVLADDVDHAVEQAHNSGCYPIRFVLRGVLVLRGVPVSTHTEE